MSNNAMTMRTEAAIRERAASHVNLQMRRLSEFLRKYPENGDTIQEVFSQPKLEFPPEDISCKDSPPLADIIRLHPNLLELDLTSNRMGTAGAFTIGNALEDTGCTVQRLDFTSNQMGADAVVHIAASLTVNKSLRFLSLYDNECGSWGAQNLAEALGVNETLVVLDAGQNNFCDASAVHLANSLKTNTTLQELDIGSNNIGDRGAEALAGALRVNKTLRVLSLNTNTIGTAGAMHLLEALKVNTTLKRLCLSDNENMSAPAGLQDERVIL